MVQFAGGMGGYAPLPTGINATSPIDHMKYLKQRFENIYN